MEDSEELKCPYVNWQTQLHPSENSAPTNLEPDQVTDRPPEKPRSATRSGYETSSHLVDDKYRPHSIHYIPFSDHMCCLGHYGDLPFNVHFFPPPGFFLTFCDIKFVLGSRSNRSRNDIDTKWTQHQPNQIRLENLPSTLSRAGEIFTNIHSHAVDIPAKRNKKSSCETTLHTLFGLLQEGFSRMCYTSYARNERRENEYI